MSQEEKGQWSGKNVWLLITGYDHNGKIKGAQRKNIEIAKEYFAGNGVAVHNDTIWDSPVADVKKALVQHCKDAVANNANFLKIYYTGHGVSGEEIKEEEEAIYGSWCFKNNGRLTLSELMQIIINNW
eukprot:373724_1